MYLELFHGRNAPDEELDDWGFEGPIIGPLDVAHVTYNNTIKISQAKVNDGHAYEVEIDDDMIHYGGAWYGDWCFISKCPQSQRGRVVPLNKTTLEQF